MNSASDKVHSPFPLWAAALVLSGAVLVVFGKFLVPGTHLILSQSGRDLDTQILWWRQFGFSELAKGHLALWTPSLFCGTPFFGYFQPALLYPPNWLFMVCPAPWTVNFLIAFHVFLAGWFTFLWIAKRGASALAALLSAFMVMFGASLFLRIVPGHLLNICAMPWTLLFLFAIEGYRQAVVKKIGWILLGVFPVGMQVLSGQMQIFYYGVLFTGAYVLFSLPEKGKIYFLASVGGMGLGGLLLGAVQILSGWDAARESLRGAGMSLDAAASTAMPVERLWCLLLPNFFGDWKNYWGGGLYWEGAVYVGLTGFVLAWTGMRGPGSQRKFFAGAFLLMALTAIGRRTFLFSFFFHVLPLFNHFRGVAKLDFFMTICLAALAALGWDEIGKNPSRLSGIAKTAGWGAGIFFALAFVVKAVAHAGGGRRYARYMPYAGGMIESLLMAAGILLIISFLTWKSRQNSKFRYGLFALTLLELFSFALGNRPYFDYSALKRKLEPLRQVYQKDPGDYRVLAGSYNYALGTGGLDIWGYDTSIPIRYARFIALTQSCNPNEFLKDSTLRRVTPAMGLVRLRYVFKDKGDHLTVKRLHFKTPPRFFLDDRWKVASQNQALVQDVQPGFDPLKEAWLESDPGISPEGGKLKSRVSLRDLSSDVIQIDAELSKPAILVLDENYSHGWKAVPLAGSVQKSYDVVPADGFLRAVPLNAGVHHFRLQYRPEAFVVGKWISIFSLGMFLFLIAFWGMGRFREAETLKERV
ncbi:MAG: hypothetical protein ACREL1_07930 [bacterium]